MKENLSKELEVNELRETKEDSLVGGVVFMDPKMVDEVMEQKHFNFICRVEKESEASNFICNVTD